MMRKNMNWSPVVFLCHGKSNQAAPICLSITSFISQVGELHLRWTSSRVGPSCARMCSRRLWWHLATAANPEQAPPAQTSVTQLESVQGTCQYFLASNRISLKVNKMRETKHLLFRHPFFQPFQESCLVTAVMCVTYFVWCRSLTLAALSQTE